MLRAAVIGCGRIGVLFDQPGHPYILSHAHGIAASPDFSLVGVMDSNSTRADEAAARWNTKGYASLDALMVDAQPDVVCVCVPNEYHYAYLKSLLAFPLKAVVAEKPLTTELASTQEIVQAYQQAGIPLLVNYTRCYDTMMGSVREKIRQGELGRIIHAVVKYSKGITHNGSHLIAAANFLFGKYQSGYPVSAIIDHAEQDPTLSAVLRYEYSDTVFLTGCDERFFSVFEIDIVYERGRFIFEELGFRFRRYVVREDPLYPGDHDLQLEDQGETGMKKSIICLWRQAAETVQNNAPVLCGGDLALQTQEVCTDLLRQYHHDK